MAWVLDRREVPSARAHGVRREGSLFPVFGVTRPFRPLRRSGPTRVFPAPLSGWNGEVELPIPAQRGLGRSEAAVGRTRRPRAPPVSRCVGLRVSPSGGCRTATPHALPREAFLLLACSKDRPFVAPEPSSPLPLRIAPPLRPPAATPTACSDLVVSRHFAGLLLDGPVRAVSAAHDPGVHRRFTWCPRTPRFPRCVPALRSVPSADGRRTLELAEASCDARAPCGEALASGPTVTRLCCTPCGLP